MGEVTSGPWEATQDRGLTIFVVRGDNHDEVICQVHTGNPADAQLIASAPEITAERDALRAQVAEMMEDRGRAALNLRDKMRTAYKAGYDTRKIGGRLNEGWAAFAPTIPDLR